MYFAKQRASAPLEIALFATVHVGSWILLRSSFAFVASALIAAGVMSGVPTMYSFLRLELTVLRPLNAITIATMPKTNSTTPAAKPPYSRSFLTFMARSFQRVRRQCPAGPAVRKRGNHATHYVGRRVVGTRNIRARPGAAARPQGPRSRPARAGRTRSAPGGARGGGAARREGERAWCPSRRTRACGKQRVRTGCAPRRPRAPPARR